MASFSTSAQCSTSDSACRISPRQIKQVRPKLPLLKILQAAGAQGEIFTVTEVMHYLGQYITMKQLYDPREQHMVYCGGDLLGELLGCQSFSVKDPSPLYAMLRRNLVALTTATTDAAQTLAIAQDQNMDIPSQDQLKQSAEESSSSRKSIEEGNISSLPTSQHKYTNSREDEDLIENLTQDETSRLDLGLEEWDVAGLPWWFLGNLRNNYTPRSNGSTDLQTNRDIGTAIVSDTTDDVWFLNESVSEHFGVGIKIEAADTEQTSEEVGKVRDKMVIEAGKNDDLEDSKSICDDTDVEVASEDEWQCTECKKFNSPSKSPLIDYHVFPVLGLSNGSASSQTSLQTAINFSNIRLNHCQAFEICSCVLIIIYVYLDVHNALSTIICKNLFLRVRTICSFFF
ncbi:protein Mdm4 isoform X2 [Pteropus medius]|uniref:protein Mdm4 isoform X2 n=1 Tax=Pteropus vampyrus TaxID=132908 RepID=UPI00196B51E0|nr:protein Mdm4 isoform X2 [Pteropus giganteus]